MKTKYRDLGNGNVEIELFGTAVVVPKGGPPKIKVRLKPYHLVKGTEIPVYLRKAVDNYLTIAEGLGIAHEKINAEIAEYLIKGYYEMALLRAA
jgi:hypothetical protein